VEALALVMTHDVLEEVLGGVEGVLGAEEVLGSGTEAVLDDVKGVVLGDVGGEVDCVNTAEHGGAEGAQYPYEEGVDLSVGAHFDIPCYKEVVDV